MFCYGEYKFDFNGDKFSTATFTICFEKTDDICIKYLWVWLSNEGYEAGDYFISIFKKAIFGNEPNLLVNIERYRLDNLVVTKILSDVKDFSYELSDDNSGVVIKGMRNIEQIPSSDIFARPKTTRILFGKIIIPSEIENLPVKEVRGFYEFNNLEEVEIPDSVEIIQSFAFANCSKLETVKLPNTMVGIAYRAFENCTSLKTINIPEHIKILQDWAFRGCQEIPLTTQALIKKLQPNAF